MGQEARTVARFLDDGRRRNLRPGTLEQKGRALVRLARHLDPAGILDATHDELVAFLDRLEHAEARATETSHLRTFYRWAMIEGLISVDPSARLIRPRVPRRLPRPMPDNDLRMAIDLAPDRIRPCFLLAAYAGLRACEISRLRGVDVLWGNTPPMLVVDEGKGGHSGAVPLHPVLEVELRQLPERGWLFPRRDGRPGPMPPHLISHYCNDHLHGLGISHTLHTIRHWFGTKSLQANGGNLRETQELMRHQSPVSTAIYTWVDPGAAAETVASLPAL